TRPEMIARVLPVIRASVKREPTRPGQLAGYGAIRQLAAVVRDGPPEALERQLIVFALPTVTRRAVDAARFLAEAGLPAAADAMGDQAALWGQACSFVARRDWTRAAALLTRVAEAERELAAAL